MPLNKISPEIPSPKDMRPICATQCLFKLIEARFTYKLYNAYENLPNKISKAQVGFMPSMNTQVNLLRLFESVRKTFSSWPEKIPLVPAESQCTGDQHTGFSSALLFIDYQAAYNSIDRKRLFDEIKKRNILNKDEADFLLWLYSNQSIKLENSEVTTKFGVPQGGINSPILFNFCMYFMLEELLPKSQEIANIHLNRNSSIRDSIVPSIENTFIFADDLAFHLYGPTKSNALQIYFKKFIILLRDESKSGV